MNRCLRGAEAGTKKRAKKRDEKKRMIASPLRVIIMAKYPRASGDGSLGWDRTGFWLTFRA